MALLLYKYRYKGRVQDFLAKFTPVKRAPYSQRGKKRSSIGQDLLFTDGCHGDSIMNQTSTLPPPVTHPSRSSLQPPLSPTAPRSTKWTPTPPLRLLQQVSPLTQTFPRSPPPTLPPHRFSQDSQDSLNSTISSFSPSLLLPITAPFTRRRPSQDSLESGVSVASSGVLSPSLLSWPVPLPPAGVSQEGGLLRALAVKYQPLAPTRVVVEMPEPARPMRAVP